MFHWKSDFLFARPSWLSGIARMWDFGGAFDSYNISRTPEEADTKAILSDWYIIGQDTMSAIENQGH